MKKINRLEHLYKWRLSGNGHPSPWLFVALSFDTEINTGPSSEPSGTELNWPFSGQTLVDMCNYYGEVNWKPQYRGFKKITVLKYRSKTIEK